MKSSFISYENMLKQQICCYLCFWLALSWLLLLIMLPSLSTNFVNAGAGGSKGSQIVEGIDDEKEMIEAMFKLNGEPKNFLDYFKEMLDTKAAMRPHPQNNQHRKTSRMHEANALRAAKNDYPLSKEQLQRRISTYEMHERMECTFENHPCYSDYGRAWNVHLKILQTTNKKTANSGGIDLIFRPLTKFYRTLSADTHENSRNPETQNMNYYFEKMMKNAPMFPGQRFDAKTQTDRTRLDVVLEALDEAKNIIKPASSKKQMVGDTDSTDLLIELLVTLSNGEKAKIEHKKSTIGVEKYCQEMVNKNGMKKNPQFALILNVLCRANRIDSFEINEHCVVDELKEILEFIQNPVEIHNDMGNILGVKNFVHLRALNEAIKQSNDSSMFVVDDRQLSGLYDVANYYHKMSTDKNKRRVWKLIKAIGTEIEFGRPRFIAEILREKIDNILVNRSVADSYGHITRIVLTRAPLDLADINEAYEQTSDNEIRMTLYDHLKALKESKYPAKTNNAYNVTIESYLMIIEWAVREMNHQFEQVAWATGNLLKMRRYYANSSSRTEDEFHAIIAPPTTALGTISSSSSAAVADHSEDTSLS